MVFTLRSCFNMQLSFLVCAAAFVQISVVSGQSVGGCDVFGECVSAGKPKNYIYYHNKFFKNIFQILFCNKAVEELDR